MEQNGFTAEVVNVQDLEAVKTRYQVPVELRSCHTAIVDGYVIEGHVPVAEIERLLAERPAIVGLAVPGMPGDSPGVGIEGAPFGSFKVMAFDQDGRTEIFASYPK